MARKHFIVCDGCDEEQAIKEGDAEVPSSFFRCKVAVGSWGVDVEICDRCHARLLENADPRKWTRVNRAA